MKRREKIILLEKLEIKTFNLDICENVIKNNKLIKFHKKVYLTDYKLHLYINIDGNYCSRRYFYLKEQEENLNTTERRLKVRDWNII